MVGGLLGIEGLHALDSDPAFVQRFYDAGVRMAAVRLSLFLSAFFCLLMQLS